MIDRSRASRAAQWLVCRAFPAAWLATFLFLLLAFATPTPPRYSAFAGLALCGFLYAVTFERDTYRELVLRHRLMLSCSVLAVASICITGIALAFRLPATPFEPVLPHIGMLLCITPLAVVLCDDTRMRGAVAVLVALCVWHLVTLPIEAMTGIKWTWFGVSLLPREAGPFRYQAAGLAWQAYYFGGVALGAFYLAYGALFEERLVAWRPPAARGWLLASLAWAAATAGVQSRSVFAGTLTASAVGLIAQAKGKRGRWWTVLLIAVLGIALFAFLFSQNKSSSGLRLAYLELYLRHSLDAQWLLTGRGNPTAPHMEMWVPGMQFVVHSHNDIAQVFFNWGLPTVLAYTIFLLTLLRLAYRFWRDGRYWPGLAIISVAPSLLTDLGLHHHEKVAFLALLAAMGIAFDMRRPAGASRLAQP